MATTGRGYFASYGFSENLKNLLLRRCLAETQIFFVEILLGWSSNRFLQAMMIGQKLWPPRGGADMAKVKIKSRWAIQGHHGPLVNVHIQLKNPYSSKYMDICLGFESQETHE